MSALFEEDQPKGKLTVEQIAILAGMANSLNELADVCDAEPLDPKISAMIRMAADMAEEQVTMDKYYSYPGCDSCGGTVEIEEPNLTDLSDEYRFFDNDEETEQTEVEKKEQVLETPSASELENWLKKGAAPKDDNE